MGAADEYYAKYGPIDILPERVAAEREWHHEVQQLEWAEMKLRWILRLTGQRSVSDEANDALEIVAGVRATLEEAMARKRRKGGRKGC